MEYVGSKTVMYTKKCIRPKIIKIYIWDKHIKITAITHLLTLIDGKTRKKDMTTYSQFNKCHDWLWLEREA